MIPELRPQDTRLQGIERKIRGAGDGICALESYVQSLPEQYQNSSRAALRKAFKLGVTMGEFEGFHQPPMFNREGELALGRALKFHLDRTRKIHTRVDELRGRLNEVFGCC